MITSENYLAQHYITRSNWLRAAVLGANDGIISVSSLAIGVATASSSREPILLATIAGMVYPTDQPRHCLLMCAV